MIFFKFSAQNIDCWYSLEPPRRVGSNEYPQSIFLSRNKKNNAYLCKLQFYYIKVGFKAVKIIQVCFCDVTEGGCTWNQGIVYKLTCRNHDELHWINMRTRNTPLRPCNPFLLTYRPIVNPFIPSRPFYLSCLEWSISNWKIVWLVPCLWKLLYFIAASHLGLTLLSMSLLSWDARHKWNNKWLSLVVLQQFEEHIQSLCCFISLWSSSMMNAQIVGDCGQSSTPPTHRFLHSHILSIFPPHDVVTAIPVFRTRMHPSGLLAVWQAK